MFPAEAECSASGKSDGGLGQKRKELAETWRDQSHDQVNEKSSGRCTTTTTTPTALQDSGRHCKQGSQISHLGSVVPWQGGGSAHHLLTGGQKRWRLFLPTSSPPKQRRSGRRLPHSLLPWSSPSMTSQEMKYVLA